jgi:hypothetical protein
MALVTSVSAAKPVAANHTEAKHRRYRAPGPSRSALDGIRNVDESHNIFAARLPARWGCTELAETPLSSRPATAQHVFRDDIANGFDVEPIGRDQIGGIGDDRVDIAHHAQAFVKIGNVKPHRFTN